MSRFRTESVATVPTAVQPISNVGGDIAIGGVVHQICYMSRAILPDEEVIRSIITVAQTLNRADGITGLLLSDGTRYLQAIEGPERALRACFTRIRHDTRHYDIVTVSDAAIEQRQFGDWSMRHRHRQMAGGNDDFRRNVMNDVAAVTDMQLKAMFIGFAALSR